MNKTFKNFCTSVIGALETYKMSWFSIGKLWIAKKLTGSLKSMRKATGTIPSAVVMTGSVRPGERVLRLVAENEHSPGVRAGIDQAAGAGEGLGEGDALGLEIGISSFLPVAPKAVKLYGWKSAVTTSPGCSGTFCLGSRMMVSSGSEYDIVRARNLDGHFIHGLSAPLPRLPARRATSRCQGPATLRVLELTSPTTVAFEDKLQRVSRTRTSG